jgi:hypothetical protein
VFDMKFRRGHKRALGAILVVLVAFVLASCEASDHADPLSSQLEGQFEIVSVENRIAADTPVEYAYFGSSVAVSGTTLVVGAWGEADRGRNTGAVYVYQRGPSGQTVQSRLTASDASEGARFGHAVAIDQNTILVGAIYHSGHGSRSGAVYVFESDADGWGETAMLTPSTPAANAYFGSAVALNDGTALIGSQGPNAGTAYVFVKSASGWLEQATLRPSDPSHSAHFGGSVALHRDTAVIGAWLDPSAASDGASTEESGAAYVFDWSGTSWTEEAVLTPFDGSGAIQFGYSVAIYEDTIAIGAPGEQEAVFLYQWSQNSWTGRVKLSPPSGTREFFGISVALGRDTLVVGAPGSDQRTGAAYVYQVSSGRWIQHSKIVGPQPGESLQMGGAVAVDEATILLGATGDRSGGAASGAAYSVVTSTR